MHDETLREGEPWHSICSALTFCKQQAGSISFGAVSPTGFGDESRRGYVKRGVEAVIVAIHVAFIGDKPGSGDKADSYGADED